MAEHETCCVADQFCKAAANFILPPYLQSECFACGQKVCVNCSTKRKYMRFGKRRICNNCQVQLISGSQVLIRNRLMKMAGYPSPAKRREEIKRGIEEARRNVLQALGTLSIQSHRLGLPKTGTAIDEAVKIAHKETFRKIPDNLMRED